MMPKAIKRRAIPAPASARAIHAPARKGKHHMDADTLAKINAYIDGLFKNDGAGLGPHEKTLFARMKRQTEAIAKMQGQAQEAQQTLAQLQQAITATSGGAETLGILLWEASQASCAAPAADVVVDVTPAAVAPAVETPTFGIMPDSVVQA